MSNEYFSDEPIEMGLLDKRKFKKFYQQFIGNSDFVITIGDFQTNVSEVVLLLGAKVLIVEPIPSNFEAFKEKVAKYEKSILLNTDIGAFDAEFTYNEAYERKILPYSSNLTVSENKSQVKITTVDNLIQNYGFPVYLRVSANGFENEVLKGLTSTVPLISVSCYSYLHEKTIEIVRRMMAIGDYEFNWVLFNECKFQSKNWLSAKELHHSMSEHKNQRYAADIFARLKNNFD